MRYLCLLISAMAALPAQTAPPARLVKIQGTARFAATTNLSAISIHGESAALAGQVRLAPAGGKTVLEDLEARVDPQSLKTGMDLRDQHMRNKIFALPGGELHALKFAAKKVECPDAAPGQEVSCNVPGSFSLRGADKPVTFRLKIKPEGARYRASGEATLKLTDFGIEPPCQLGVCVQNEVKVKLEFQGHELTERSQLDGGRR